MNKYRKQEIFVLGLIWLLVFLIPLVLEAYRVLSGRSEAFSFRELGWVWLSTLPFLVLFLLHELAARLFFRPGKRGIYLALTACLLLLFGVWIFAGPDRPRNRRQRVEMGWQRPPEPRPELRMLPQEKGPFPDAGPRLRRGFPRPFTPQAMKFILGVLMLAAALGLKAYFRSRRNEERLAELERENLRQNLQFLRYQINPHFFMNTLNNIHALVDIDPEQAKASVLELSKLMRYVLYEGDKPTIPLEKEVEFLSHYIGLMRIRYAESVDIRFLGPEDCAGIEVPPLMFVTFVENAFKHGISYESQSFIHVSLSTGDGCIVFRCDNSTHASSRTDSPSGIGLANVRRRLDLLYGEDYLLDLKEEEGAYRILVQVPYKPREL